MSGIFIELRRKEVELVPAPTACNDPKFEAVEAEFTSQHVLLGGRVLF